MQVADLDFQLFVLSNGLKDEMDDVTGRVTLSVTSGLAVAIVAPAASRLNDLHPRLSLDLREQVSLVNFENNQADLMLSLSPISRADVESVEIGTLHLVPIASREYLEKSGVPQRQFISQHVYVQCKYYDSDREIWRGWQSLVNSGQQTHHCENSLAYYALIKNGAGVGLLGNYVLADPELVPLDLGVHVALPIYLISLAARRQSKPVAAVYDWLVNTFKTNPSFANSLTFPSGGHEQEEGLRKMLQTIASPPPPRDLAKLFRDRQVGVCNIFKEACKFNRLNFWIVNQPAHHFGVQFGARQYFCLQSACCGNIGPVVLAAHIHVVSNELGPSQWPSTRSKPHCCSA